MPIATIGQPVEIECPWCGAKVTPAITAAIANKFKLSDMGRDKMQTGACPACGRTVGIVLKALYYRVVQVPA